MVVYSLCDYGLQYKPHSSSIVEYQQDHWVVKPFSRIFFWPKRSTSGLLHWQAGYYHLTQENMKEIIFLYYLVPTRQLPSWLSLCSLFGNRCSFPLSSYFLIGSENGVNGESEMETQFHSRRHNMPTVTTVNQSLRELMQPQSPQPGLQLLTITSKPFSVYIFAVLLPVLKFLLLWSTELLLGGLSAYFLPFIWLFSSHLAPLRFHSSGFLSEQSRSLKKSSFQVTFAHRLYSHYFTLHPTGLFVTPVYTSYHSKASVFCLLFVGPHKSIYPFCAHVRSQTPWGVKAM